MSQDDIDIGRKEGLSTSEREELAKLRRDNRRLEMEVEISSAHLPTSRRRMCSQLGFRLVQELATDGFDVAVACRVLKVSRSGYYEWCDRPPSTRDLENAYLRRHHAPRTSAESARSVPFVGRRESGQDTEQVPPVCPAGTLFDPTETLRRVQLRHSTTRWDLVRTL